MRLIKLSSVSSVVGLVLASGLMGCALESQGEGGESVGSASQAWLKAPGTAGFVFSDKLTGSFSAQPARSYNSSAGVNVISNIATGVYRVDFPGIGSPGGNVQVTAHGADNMRCKVSDWVNSGTTLQVTVRCFDGSGNPANSLFTAQYLRRTDTPGSEAAYVWSFNSTSPGYNPDSGRAWSSTGQAMSISNTGDGIYNVNLPGQDMSGGTVEVTAFGTNNVYCKVIGWFSSTAQVRCFNGGSGAPQNSQFVLLFSSKVPHNTPASTYVWAHDPSSASYAPVSPWTLGLISHEGNNNPHSAIASPVNITRSGTGRYRVFLPLMASMHNNPSSVKVTGYGFDGDTCKVRSWAISGADANVDVACFSSLGAPVDALYTLTYSSFATTSF